VLLDVAAPGAATVVAAAATATAAAVTAAAPAAAVAAATLATATAAAALALTLAAAAGACIPAAYLTCLGVGLAGGDTAQIGVIENLGAVAVAVACWYGIIRYGLFNSRAVLSRTLLYGALTVAVVAVYLAASALLGQLFAGAVPNVEGLTRPTYALRSMEILDEVILALRRLHQPVIAAVNGPAIGGGLCLALAADIRVASTNAYFRAAGINNGLTASELGLSYLLPRAIGASRAFEIMLTGRDVSAEEAERIGLVSCQVPEAQLLDTCYAIAARIAAFSRPGIELTKRTLWSGLDAGSLEGHMQAEGLGQLFVRLLTANFEEAVAARAERRPPVFTDDK